MSALNDALRVEAAASRHVFDLNQQLHDLMVAIDRANDALQVASRAVEREVQVMRDQIA